MGPALGVTDSSYFHYAFGHHDIWRYETTYRSMGSALDPYQRTRNSQNSWHRLCIATWQTTRAFWEQHECQSSHWRWFSPMGIFLYDQFLSVFELTALSSVPGVHTEDWWTYVTDREYHICEAKTFVFSVCIEWFRIFSRFLWKISATMTISNPTPSQVHKAGFWLVAVLRDFDLLPSRVYIPQLLGIFVSLGTRLHELQDAP